MSQKSSNTIYSVFVFRTDGQHLEPYTSDNYDKCFETWEALLVEWTSSVKEQRPFILREPLITAFSPALIFEIKLIPVASSDSGSKNNNPYSKKMHEEGFGRTFPSQGRDLI